MGQRTQNILIIVDEKTNSKEVYLTHDQWGIGRVMPFDILSFIQTIENKRDYRKELKDFVKDSFLNTRYDISDEIQMLPNHEQFSILDIENIGNIFANVDNNNGGSVIQVLIDKDGFFDITIGYMQGYEETNSPFCKYVEPCKWVLTTWGKYNKTAYKKCLDFFNGYKSICKSYDIKHIIGTKDNYIITDNLKPCYRNFNKTLDK